jgi:hypothetical protein
MPITICPRDAAPGGGDRHGRGVALPIRRGRRRHHFGSRVAVLLSCGMLLLGALGAAASGGNGAVSNPPVVPPARSGDIAIQQELEAARAAGTRDAYDLFIARHPGHPLERVAREERAKLEGQSPGR